MSQIELVTPDASALAMSNQLLEVIREKIERSGGVIPFDQYMEMALYQPGLGYYDNNKTPFGEHGDFITASEIGSLFARSLARPISDVILALAKPSLMEVGAGSGAFAIDVMRELEKFDALPEEYLVFERSPAMQALQKEKLASAVPHLFDRFRWLDELPEQSIDGVIFANEVADALPVKRFRWQQGAVVELGVAFENGECLARDIKPDPALVNFVNELSERSAWMDGYQSEWCPGLKSWVQSLTNCLSSGLFFTFDYGYARAEYYDPQRSMGTLITHARHRASDDPFRYPGLQDITAFVDFTGIAESCVDTDLKLCGFHSQAGFLIDSGIDQLLSELDPADSRTFLAASGELKRLVLPSEMGERFKCIGFSRNLDSEIRGFAANDLRSRL